MSEPHELERKAMLAMYAAPRSSDGTPNYLNMARAAFEVVRQEQEALVPGNQWERTWLHAWWLSNTAPQEK